MAQKFIITLDDSVPREFAIKFLKSIKFIKSVKAKKAKIRKSNTSDKTKLSESPLAEDWLSDEDDHWDQVI